MSEHDSKGPKSVEELFPGSTQGKQDGPTKSLGELFTERPKPDQTANSSGKLFTEPTQTVQNVGSLSELFPEVKQTGIDAATGIDPFSDTSRDKPIANLFEPVDPKEIVDLEQRKEDPRWAKVFAFAQESGLDMTKTTTNDLFFVSIAERAASAPAMLVLSTLLLEKAKTGKQKEAVEVLKQRIEDQVRLSSPTYRESFIKASDIFDRFAQDQEKQVGQN